MSVGANGNGNSRSSGVRGQNPIAFSFALLVVAALVVLWALRHVFGSVRAEVGTH